MADTDRLFASSSPNYNGRDSSHRITTETIEYLRANNITNIISLNEEANSDHIIRALAAANIAYTPLPVMDYLSPTLHELERGWESFLQHRSGTLIWCGYGYGRTGTMITALQMYSQQQRSEFRPWTSDDYRSNFVESESQIHTLNQLQSSIQLGSHHEPMDIDATQQEVKSDKDEPMDVDDQHTAGGARPKLRPVDQPPTVRQAANEPMDVDDEHIAGGARLEPRPVDQPPTVRQAADEPMEVDRQVDDSMIERLRLGSFTGLSCPALLNFVLQQYGSSPRRRSTPSLSIVMPTAQASATADCITARQALIQQESRSHCRKIKNLEIGIKIANVFTAGTYDTIGAIVVGKSGTATFDVVDNPSKGFQSWVSVDMKSAFGSDTIDIDDVSSIKLTARGTIGIKPPILINDEWKVQGVMLRAKCSKTGYEAYDDAFVSLNSWYNHPSIWILNRLRTKTVVSLQIGPEDWHVTPCETINKLEYEFKLGDEFLAGTSDSISFTLGEEQGKNIEIGGNINRGFSRTDTVNLTYVFGSDTVEMHREGGTSGIFKFWFPTLGITFTATCAGLKQQMYMTKFASEDVWLGHDRYKEVVWTGDIAATDWHPKQFIPDPPKRVR
ncbi:hypothetical protein DCS_05818 [Drechmeria coniospora]|uniref:Swiss Army Knife protein DSP-PTPase phosphatase domain-containing protein n=1 Tax=Drechmeria coniospora TaxID=98403 RepID=A0A151GNY5_DRECN|nr:hypothetical protein DCS_05818 [Drechmeria coniospora]KYK58800.1 hypothetical protein DCS_05818 [Drechmeria coniospora]